MIMQNSVMQFGEPAFLMFELVPSVDVKPSRFYKMNWLLGGELLASTDWHLAHDLALSLRWQVLDVRLRVSEEMFVMNDLEFVRSAVAAQLSTDNDSESKMERFVHFHLTSVSLLKSSNWVFLVESNDSEKIRVFNPLTGSLICQVHSPKVTGFALRDLYQSLQAI
jgi:hypothetical protein